MEFVLAEKAAINNFEIKKYFTGNRNYIVDNGMNTLHLFHSLPLSLFIVLSLLSPKICEKFEAEQIQNEASHELSDLNRFNI